MFIEALPAIIAVIIVAMLTLTLVKTHRRALRAEERAEDAERQMGNIMKYRGITRSDLDALAALERSRGAVK